MSLSDYHKKRSFDRTPEPKGTTKSSTGPLRFVIQKHQASRLHYDFRLELNGVLKSWAIPRGPSLNPNDKRLAMMVEDHPMDYENFEGIIPKGQYGGGTVMVWDKGVYHTLAFVDRKQAEAMLEAQIEKGDIKFVMLGEKIQGEFALVRTHKKDEEPTWLLIKKHDEYATQKDILLKEKSVITGRSLDEIKSQAIKKKEVWFSKPNNINVNHIPKGEMPHDIKPMLAQSSDEPFDNEEWLFEMKYDGYRAIAEKKDGDVSLYSRNGIAYEEKFAPIVSSLKKFPGDVVLDGEVVVVDESGHPHFQWLQDYPNGKKGELVYFVFDLLYYDGYTLSTLPLYRRKELLSEILPPLPGIKFSDHIEGTGIAMFQQIQTLGLEGIMAKHKESTYQQGTRTSKWLKIKTQNSQEVVIAGFTRPNGGRKHFGALIMGEYKKGKLKYIGHVGGGFDDKRLESIYEKLQHLIVDHCPFDTTPETNAPVTWVTPKILAEVSFSNITNEGQLRHPIFIRLHEDKDTNSSSVIPGLTRNPEHKEILNQVQNDNMVTDEKEERYFSKDPIQKENKEIAIGKQTLTLTNLNKVFWPKEGYTKNDLISYYREIAPVILPYLKDRPESLLRYPNGITGQSFYQKNSGLLGEDWIPKTIIHSESGNKDIPYLLCQDEATLIYLINLGCIDLNPWSSRVESLENPDYLLIDLDPEDTSFANVITTALTVREVLESLDIPNFVKTSGAKGMHIYIPLEAKYTYEQSRKLAELLCLQVHHKIPGITSMKRNPKDRQGLIYLDYLQNTQGQTLATAYSVRAQPFASVSTPLKWNEVTPNLHPSQFTIKNIQERIQKYGDLFEGVLGKGIDMEKLLEKMSKFT